GLLVSTSAVFESNVEGTQSSASTLASSPFLMPSPMAAISASDALVPFIFQLPATSGRIPGVMITFPSLSREIGLSYQKPATKQSTQAGKDGMPDYACHPLIFLRLTGRRYA